MVIQSVGDMRERFRLQAIFFFEFVDLMASVVWKVRRAPAIRTFEAIEQCHGIVVYPVSCKMQKQIGEHDGERRVQAYHSQKPSSWKSSAQRVDD